MILLILSFIAGVLTVLAPCILPLLPVIIGGSLSGDAIGVQKKKVFTIVISLSISIILFTFLLKVSTIFINISPAVFSYVSGGIIIIFGLVTIFPSLYEGKFIAKLSSKSNMILAKGDKKKSFLGDIIIGAALGPVFSTCSPTYFLILATVLPVSPLLGFVYLLAYTAGLSLMLLVIAFIGQKIMGRLNIVSNPDGWVKKTFGILFIIVGLAILTGYDKKVETYITGSGFFDVTTIEQKLLQLNKGGQVVDSNGLVKAPEISTPDGFINTDGKPITIGQFKGKVVLLDIWTYNCINCQRTIPHLNDLYAKYKDKGLVIIGLHTPEFSFEKVQKNVEEAVKGFSIKYPVVMDNDFSTWNAYGNQYWPRKYLINKDGYIVYDHIGEGGYDETEAAIRKALGLDTSVDTSSSDQNIDKQTIQSNSPETYFGYNRNEYLSNGKSHVAGLQSLTIPNNIDSNKLYLGGNWNFEGEYAENKGTANIVFKYNAAKVYFVAGSDTGVTVQVYKDGVFIKDLLITDEKLYNLIDDNDGSEHTLEIRVKDQGLKAFTFTFG